MRSKKKKNTVLHCLKLKKIIIFYLDVFVGVRIWDIFSIKSSLNDLARLANFVPRKLFLWVKLLCGDSESIEKKKKNKN